MPFYFRKECPLNSGYLTVQNCGYEAVVSVSAGTGRGYRPAEREYPATITPVVAVIQDGVSVAC